MRRRVLQSQIESWDPWKFTPEALAKVAKPELVRFVRDFHGGCWWHLRSLSKETLIEIILEGHKEWGFDR